MRDRNFPMLLNGLIVLAIFAFFAVASASSYPTRKEWSLASRRSQSDDATKKCGSKGSWTGNATLAKLSDEALYREAYRPKIHFTPPTGFQNDPNGLVRTDDGVWHLYYQYNPAALVAGFQHWGHATSRDLYTWISHPPAIAPNRAGEGVFSGSAVLDRDNTSGFFNSSTSPGDRIVAIYTYFTPQNQTQEIAYSTDRGMTFTKYSGNPVLQRNQTQFRDPKVFWDAPRSRWVMAVSLSQHYAIVFYSSPDLKTWTELSQFQNHGFGGAFQYECPDLIHVPVQGGPKDGERVWVLVVSINPGMPLGGSAIQYFIGDWDGTSFVPSDNFVRLADWGKEYYAAQSYFNAPNNSVVAIGWASNWQYTNVVPTSPYRSAQTIPRELVLRYERRNGQTNGYVLASTPYNLDSIKGQALYPPPSSPAPAARSIESSADLASESEKTRSESVTLSGNGAYVVDATLVFPSNATATYNSKGTLTIRGDSGGQVVTGVQIGETNTIFLSRRGASGSFGDENDYFNERFSVQPAAQQTVGKDVKVHMTVVIDRTVVEVFTDEGRQSAVANVFWKNNGKPESVEWAGMDGVEVQNVKVTELKSGLPC